jgi:hypothetical protein
MEEIELGADLFAAGLLLPIGKALMACFYPKSTGDKSWPDLSKYCEKAGERAVDLMQLLEPKWFGATHAEMGALFVNFGALLDRLEKPIFFYTDPERLERTDHDLFQLSSVLSIASRLARTSDKKLRLESFHSAWLDENDLTADALKSVLAAALKAK